MNYRYCILFIVCFIILPTSVLAQSFSFAGEIGTFKSAASLTKDQMGNLYISDIGSNKIYKIDTLGNLLKSFGGYGWDENGFDQPVDIHSNSLKIYVSDKNNNSVKIFDKDLNYISSINGENQQAELANFRFPVCTRVSSQGDIYILDSEEGKILKFDFTNKFISYIGDYDAGVY